MSFCIISVEQLKLRPFRPFATTKISYLSVLFVHRRFSRIDFGKTHGYKKLNATNPNHNLGMNSLALNSN